VAKPIKAIATTFLRRNQQEFSKPIKLIAKELPEIIEKLLLLCSNEDKKIALEAMKALLKHHADMVSEKSKDEIVRLIAQARNSSGLLGGSTASSNVPMVNFGEIIDVN
jgi:hypothetical protein